MELKSILEKLIQFFRVEYFQQKYTLWNRYEINKQWNAILLKRFSSVNELGLFDCFIYMRIYQSMHRITKLGESN